MGIYILLCDWCGLESRVSSLAPLFIGNMDNRSYLAPSRSLVASVEVLDTCRM